MRECYAAPLFVVMLPRCCVGLWSDMTVAEAGWPLHMRCLPAGRECAALAAMLVAVAAKVTLLQRPRRLRLSRLYASKSQGAASCGSAQRCRGFSSSQLNLLCTVRISFSLQIDAFAFSMQVARARALGHAPGSFAHHLGALALLSPVDSSCAPRVARATRAAHRDPASAVGVSVRFGCGSQYGPVVRRGRRCGVVPHSVIA